jgi:hypothetical protein
VLEKLTVFNLFIISSYLFAFAKVRRKKEPEGKRDVKGGVNTVTGSLGFPEIQRWMCAFKN